MKNMKTPIKAPHGTAILTACFIISLLFISWASKQLDSIALLIPPSTQTAAVADFDSNLVAHYTFDGNANDSAGSNNGTASGGPTYVTGKIGQAVQMDGVDDYVQITAPSLANLNAVSLSFWINTSSFASCTSGNAAIIEKQYFTHGWLLNCNSSGFLGFTQYTTGGNGGMVVMNSVALNTDAWIHVVFSWDGNLNGTNAKFYINGQNSTNLLQAGTGSKANDSGLPINIGKDQYDGGFFTGKIDDVRVYNKPLSAIEVGELYTLGEGTTPVLDPIPDSNPDPILLTTNGQCGTTENTCTQGTLNNTTDSSTHYLWQCVGSNGGTTASCSVAKPTEPPAPTTSGTYYIDYDNGSDSNSGSVSAPWKHVPGDANATGVPAALRTIPAGTKILLKGGVTYRGAICFNGGMTYCGTETALAGAVTLSGDSYPGYENTKAIIDGSQKITDWNKCESQSTCGGNPNWQNIFYSSIQKPSHFVTPALSLNIYEGTQLISTAQYPDALNQYYPTYTNYLSVPYSAVTSTSLTDSRLAAFGSELVGKYIYIFVQPNEIIPTKILSFNSSTNTITFASTLVYGDRDTKYAISNLLNGTVLSKEGEYYFDETAQSNGLYKVFVWPYNESNLSNGNITYSTKSSGITVWYPNNSVIEGFKIQKQSGDKYCTGSAITRAGSDVSTNIVIRNNEITMGKSQECGRIKVLGSNNVTIENNYIHDNAGGGRGIEVAGTMIKVIGNTIHNTGRTPIYCGGCKNSAIIGNIITDNQGPHSNGISVYQKSDNVLISNNKVSNSNAPFTFEDGTNFTIVNNMFLGNGVYCWGGCNSGVFANNIIEGGSLLISPYLSGTWSIYNNIGLNSIIGSNSSNLSVDSYPAIDRSVLFANAPRARFGAYDINKLSTRNNVNIVYGDDVLYSEVIKNGDILIFENDGVQRTVTGVLRTIFGGNWATRISFTPSLPLLQEGIIKVWPPGTTNFTEDYHLKSGSPAIGAGVDLNPYLAQAKTSFPYYNFGSDINGNSRGSAWDIGAYEYTGSVTPTYTTGDFNRDGLVNSVDLSLLASYWNQNNATHDLNNDNTVNSLDYGILVQNWSI